MDIGVLQTGAQTVPIYPTISEDDYDISWITHAIYCFVSDAEILRKINLIRDKIPNVRRSLFFQRNWRL
jgi:long-chain acyl-CoA synthetase